MSLETLRTIILSVGWPVLVVGSIFIAIQGWLFYESLKGSIFARLVLPSVFGWLVTMYSLGVTATFYMVNDVSGATIVLPIFLVWFVTFVTLLAVTFRWSKEAVKLHHFYDSLEQQVEERTAELTKAHKKELANEKQIRKLKDELLFIAAHELRSPVNAIKWGLDAFITERYTQRDIPDESMDLLKNVYERNEHLVSLADNLLNIARLEEGALQIKTEEVDLNEIIDDAIQETQPLAKNTHIHILGPKNRPLPHVLADKAMTKEVIVNLVNNAVKYNKENGVVSFAWTEKSRALVLEVKDTGIGIPAKDLERMFKKFHRADNAKRGHVSGAGLGLYIVKKLVTKMKGSIKVESMEGKGSVFFVSLPLADSNEKQR